MAKTKDNSQWGSTAQPKDEQYLANMAREHAEGLAAKRKPLEVPTAPQPPAENDAVDRHPEQVELLEPEPTSAQTHSQVDDLAAVMAEMPQPPAAGADADTAAGGPQIRLAKADTRQLPTPALRLLIQIVLVAALTALAAAVAWIVR